MQKKNDLVKEKAALEKTVAEKDALLQQQLRTVGNYVHDSVQISKDEVAWNPSHCCSFANGAGRQQGDS